MTYVPVTCFVSREGLVIWVPLHHDVRCPERCFPAALPLPPRSSRRVGNLGQGKGAEVRCVVGHYGLGKNVVPEISPQGERQHNLPQGVRDRRVRAKHGGVVINIEGTNMQPELSGKTIKTASKTGTAAGGWRTKKHFFVVNLHLHVTPADTSDRRE